MGNAVLDGRSSLISFGVAQVLMDIEPGVRMIVGRGDLHGWSHTLVGAIPIGALATMYVLCVTAIGLGVRAWLGPQAPAALAEPGQAQKRLTLRL